MTVFRASLQTHSRGLTIIVLVAPIIFAFIMYPGSFTLSWNEGRGGFLFALIFIVFELASTRDFRANSKRLYIVCALCLLTILYLASPETVGIKNVIGYSAPAFGVVLLDSWRWMWEFIVLVLYFSSSLFVLFGTKFYRIAPATIVYLAGNGTILFLDAFFPYDSLGPLQLIVPLYLEADEVVINWVDRNLLELGPGVPAVAQGNSLVLSGLNGPFALRVFWPSAGVHSLIIYTIVMLVFLLKIEIPNDRRVAYFVIGTIGTAVVNIVRIISLSFFPLLVTTNVGKWEGYHSVAGEIMFLPWLGVYLFTIMYIEQRLRLSVPKMGQESK
jgi:thaumarchaeosortase